MRVLFICSGNSCRSIMAEAIFNANAPSGWLATSAGTQPTGAVNRRTLELLQREGFDTSGLSSKSADMLRGHADIVITLCSRAVGEYQPPASRQILRSHWGLPDPALVSGGNAEMNAAFERVYLKLQTHIQALLALPLHTVRSDRAGLQVELDRLGATM